MSSQKVITKWRIREQLHHLDKVRKEEQRRRDKVILPWIDEDDEDDGESYFSGH